MNRVIAVDWSGDRSAARTKIWLAEVRDGELVRLENGRDREEMAEHLIADCHREPHTIIGLDFAFSFPRWFVRQLSATKVDDLWRIADAQAEVWLEACTSPFWGRPGTKRPSELPDHWRRTEAETRSVAGITPKSTFQIGGAGAVGTGSVRGMRLLHRLRQAGFSVWPFHPPSLPLVVEIYPRLLTGPVNKSSATARHEYLARQLPDLPTAMRTVAAASEDAFDAAVSALVMWQHRIHLAVLEQSTDPHILLEGWIWEPDAAMEPASATSLRANVPDTTTSASAARHVSISVLSSFAEFMALPEDAQLRILAQCGENGAVRTEFIQLLDAHQGHWRRFGALVLERFASHLR